MFGTLRFFLALLVVINHLLGILNVGQFAVFGFYTLSGYLITLIMHQTYSNGLKGFFLFWLNRALRLLPSYWISILLSISLIYWLGESFLTTYNAAMTLPDSVEDWVRNITIGFWAYNPSTISPRLSPPTWAISVELAFYLIISLGASRNFRLVMLWWTGSIIFHLFAMSFLSYGDRYFTIIAASLPFSTGALFYHLHKSKQSLGYILSNKTGSLFTIYCLSLIVFCLLYFCFRYLLPHENIAAIILNIEFYLSYILVSAIILGCIYSRNAISIVFNKYDKLLGDLSYPIYLFHFQCGVIASQLLFGEPIRGRSIESVIIFPVALVFLLICSYLVVFFVEKPIENLRRLVRKSS